MEIAHAERSAIAAETSEALVVFAPGLTVAARHIMRPALLLIAAISIAWGITRETHVELVVVALPLPAAIVPMASAPAAPRAPATCAVCDAEGFRDPCADDEAILALR